MNWKIGVTAFVLLACAVMVFATNPQTATVIYIVPTVVDFTINMPASTTTITFEPATNTQSGVNASNQTSAQPIMNIQNTGNIATYYDLNLTSANPSWVTLQCGPAFGSWQAQCGCQGSTGSPATATKCCNITTAYSRINGTITAINDYQRIWCWANFSSAPAGSVSRTMSINGSTA